MLTAMVIHLDSGLGDTTAEDMLEFQPAAKRPQVRSAEGAHAAWQILVDIDRGRRCARRWRPGS